VGGISDKAAIPKGIPVILFLVSFTVISFQIALLRSLSFLRYYHFAYLVIGTALLGFGASGTFLSLFRKIIEKSLELWISWLVCLFAASIPLCYLLAQAVPLDVQYMFVQGVQLLFLASTILILTIPFFCGALLIGIFLSSFSSRVHTLYGINLLGSGAGGMCVLPFMTFFSPDRFPVITALPAAAAALVWLSLHLRRVGYSIAAGCMALMCILLFTMDISLPPDQYKALSMLRRLEKQGDASHLSVSYNGRSRIDLYSSPAAHQTLFAGPGSSALPPEQLMLLEDGEVSGILFEISDAREAEVMDSTPQSLPYRLAYSPRVLLLFDSGNVNIWLGKRFGAREIVLVHPDLRIIELIQEHTRSGIPVYFIAQDPRLYLEQNRGKENFDIIHIAGTEGMPAVAGGLGSLNENHLLTQGGLTSAYAMLTDRGYISITRGIQNPPRDNIKIFRLFARVLTRAGKLPADHLLQGRNYLAVNTILSKNSLGNEDIQRYSTACKALSIDPEYYPGIPAEPGNYINMIAGPEGSFSSWYRYAALAVVRGGENEFGRAYLFQTNPPRDDSPYFHHFFKLESLKEYIRAYGGLLFQRIELGFIILVFSLAAVIVFAFLLILLPLAVKRTDLSEVKGKYLGISYFLCIGLAFMFLEVVSIQKFGLHLGNPVFSAAAVITSILVCAGTGSITVGKVSSRLKNPFLLPLFPLLAVITVYLFLPDLLLPSIAGFSAIFRFFIVILLLAPPAFFMGWFFPLGLSLYQGERKPFIPFAWGVNGFASVAASPLVLLLSMTFGFRFVMILSGLLYTVAVLSISVLQYRPED